AFDTSPPVSNPSRRRQLTQTPVSSRMVAPHFSHFACSFVALGSGSERESESVIAITRFLLPVMRTGNGSRRPRRQAPPRFARLRRAADCGNVGAYCAAVFSRLFLPFPVRQIGSHMTVHRVRL